MAKVPGYTDVEWRCKYTMYIDVARDLLRNVSYTKVTLYCALTSYTGFNNELIYYLCRECGAHS